MSTASTESLSSPAELETASPEVKRYSRLKQFAAFGEIGFGLIFVLVAALFVGPRLDPLLLVLGRIVPVLILPLFYKVTRLDDADLLARLRGLAAGTGLNIEGVYRLHLSAETKKANAALAGLGKSRRVLLGDTLLEQFSPDE